MTVQGDGRGPVRPGSLRALAGIAVFGLSTAAAAAAPQVTISPQGAVSNVHQVVATFSEAMARTGEYSESTLAVHCDGRSAESTAGNVHWTDPHTLLLDLDRPLPAQARCTITLGPGLRSQAGVAMPAVSPVVLHTGTPSLQRIVPQPNLSQEIVEHQTFALLLTGPVDPAHLRAQAHCEIATGGPAERVEVQPVSAAERAWLAKGLRFEKHPERVAVFTCARALPNGARVTVEWQPERLAPDAPVPAPDRIDYRVRSAFGVRLEAWCDDVNAQLARRGGLRCNDEARRVDANGRVRVVFSRAIPMAQALRVRLKTGGGELAPVSGDLDRIGDGLARAVRFNGPFKAGDTLLADVPADLSDRDGDLRVDATVAIPPLHVASGLGAADDPVTLEPGPFGVLGRTAPPAVQVDLLAGLRVQGVRVLRVAAERRADGGFDDRDLMRWLELAQQLQGYGFEARGEVARALGDVEAAHLPARLVRGTPDQDVVATSTIALLADVGAATSARMVMDPAPATGGRLSAHVPLVGPGLQLVELAYDAPAGDDISGPAFERSAVLVTDLAVHLLLGRHDSLAWVTSLSTGSPVAGATVQLSDCAGRRVDAGVTDAQGTVKLRDSSTAAYNACAVPFASHDIADRFASARLPLAGGLQDVAVVWTSWDQGLRTGETPPGAVGVPMSGSGNQLVHTFVARGLVAAGQMVSMKHWLRRYEDDDLVLPPRAAWPTRLVLRDPAGEEIFIPLHWSDRGDAQWAWQVPAKARRGRYLVEMETSGESRQVARFEVRDFRVPEAQVTLAAVDAPWRAGQPGTLEVTARYLNGGPAAGMPVGLDSVLRVAAAQDGPVVSEPAPAGFPELSFDAGPVRREKGDRWDGGESFERAFEDDEAPDPAEEPVHGPHQTATIDARGHARFKVATGQDANLAQVAASLRFDDPDGEVLRAKSDQTVWPAARRVGVRLQRIDDGTLQLDAAVVDLTGHPVIGAKVALELGVAQVRSDTGAFRNGIEVTHSQTTWEPRALPSSCARITNAEGRLTCFIQDSGKERLQVEAAVADEGGAMARSHDSARLAEDFRAGSSRSNPSGLPVRHAVAATLPYKALQVLAERGVHRVGDVVHIEIDGHFDHAATLLSIERDGVIESRVVTLDGNDPTIALTVGHRWMPGVFVGVQALQRDADKDVGQGRIGGRSAPVLRTGRDYLRVDSGPLKLEVKVKPETADVRVHDVARLHVAVKRADGRPAPAGTHVALAVVNESLFALMPDGSRELEGLLSTERWSRIDLSSQQGLRPARPLGVPWAPRGYFGEGGAYDRANVQRVELTGSSIHTNAPPPPARLRSVFDSALAWLPDVTLAADGTATVEVPTNDSLARWRVVAVADASTSEDALLAGRGEATFDTRQPLQLSAGLPPVVRTGDRSTAVVAVRNDTAAAMRVRLTARAGARQLDERRVDVPAQGRVDVGWDTVAPAQVGETVWEFAATTEGGAQAEQDRVAFRQQVLAKVPRTVRQGTLVQLDRSLALPLEATGHGEARVAVRAMASLADNLPGVEAYFRAYRYNCLEQRISRAIGQRDEAAWARIIEDLPSYFDSSDLLSWFPAPHELDGGGDPIPSASGSDILSSYVLAITAQAGSQGLPFVLPPVLRQRVVDALASTAHDTLRRDDGGLAVAATTQATLRRLAAIEALSRVGAAQPGMLDGLVLDVRWPTASVIDLRNVVSRLAALPDRAATLQRIDVLLRGRLDVRGTRVSLAAGRDDWSSMMSNADVDAVRIATLAVDDPAWNDVAPRLLAGALSRQQGGHWSTTVANALGTLLADDFAKRFESQAVAGTTTARVGRAAPAAIAWDATPAGATLDLPLPPTSRPTLQLSHRGTGAPWVSVLESATVAATRPVNNGFSVRKTVTPLTPHPDGVLQRGDVLRVRLDVEALGDSTWVAVDDPVPGGATVVGDQRGWGGSAAAYVDQRFDRYQAFFAHVAAGHFEIEYTIRLDTVGRFGMPATRVEAMYAPDVFGEWPNAAIVVVGH